MVLDKLESSFFWSLVGSILVFPTLPPAIWMRSIVGSTHRQLPVTKDGMVRSHQPKLCSKQKDQVAPLSLSTNTPLSLMLIRAFHHPTRTVIISTPPTTTPNTLRIIRHFHSHRKYNRQYGLPESVKWWWSPLLQSSTLIIMLLIFAFIITFPLLLPVRTLYQWKTS